MVKLTEECYNELVVYVPDVPTHGVSRRSTNALTAGSRQTVKPHTGQINGVAETTSSQATLEQFAQRV